MTDYRFRFGRSGTVATALFVLICIGKTRASEAEFRELVVERTFTETSLYRCLISVPDEYEADDDRRWPLVMFLHGGGNPKLESLKASIRGLANLPAIVVAPICPPSKYGDRYTNWNWRQLGDVVRRMGKDYRIDENRRSVIGFSHGGSGAWELPSFEDKLFTKCVVIAGVCHPWSLRHYPKIKVWVFVGAKDYMRKEQQETVTSAKRFNVDVVETVWEGADHSGIFKNAMSYQRMLDWLVKDEDLRVVQPDVSDSIAK